MPLSLCLFLGCRVPVPSSLYFLRVHVLTIDLQDTLPFASHWVLMDFGCVFRGLPRPRPPIPALISNRVLSEVAQARPEIQVLISRLAPIHLFAEHYHWQLLGKAGGPSIFQKNISGLFVFVFASTLNSDCIPCLDTTIINFPVCSSLLAACHGDAVMDNVRCGTG